VAREAVDQRDVVPREAFGQEPLEREHADVVRAVILNRAHRAVDERLGSLQEVVPQEADRRGH